MCIHARSQQAYKTRVLDSTTRLSEFTGCFRKLTVENRRFHQRLVTGYGHVAYDFSDVADLPYNLSMTSESLEVERIFGDRSENGVLCLKGPLTFENLPKFQNAIRRENVPTVILDLTDVPYIDSAGLGSLVSVHVSRHKMGRRMVSGVNARIIHLLEITRMDQLFLVFPSLSDAIDALNNPGMA